MNKAIKWKKWLAFPIAILAVMAFGGLIDIWSGKEVRIIYWLTNGCVAVVSVLIYDYIYKRNRR